MTTPDNHQYENSGKLEQMLQGIQRKVTDIGANCAGNVRGRHRGDGENRRHL